MKVFLHSTAYQKKGIDSVDLSTAILDELLDTTPAQGAVEEAFTIADQCAKKLAALIEILADKKTLSEEDIKTLCRDVKAVNHV